MGLWPFSLKHSSFSPGFAYTNENVIDRELRNLASMPITEEVLDELVGEKKETPTHAAKDTAKEGKDKIHVAKNIMEASKASKEKVIKTVGKAKMNIRKRIDSEKDPERQNSRGQILLKDMTSKDKDDGGGGVRSAGGERRRDKSERRKDLHLQTSSPPALAASSSSSAEVQYGGGGGGGPFAFDHAGKKSSVAATMSNNGDVVYSGANASAATGAIDSLEQVEALIKMKKLPAETVAIHSPESGTTLY